MKTTILSGLTVMFFAFGCTDEVPVGGFEGGGGAGEGGGPTLGGGDEGGADEGGGSGGVVRIHLTSTADPFEHTDGLSGQTPIAHASGIRSLTLFREEADPEPLVVFDFGQQAVEADYAAGSDTVVHTASTSDLDDGVFTIARVVHSYVKYRIDATMHNGLVVPGEFDNFQALSDGTLYDGELYDSGDYEYVFIASGMEFPTSGTGAPVPEFESAGGFSVRFEDGEWAYYFPVNLPVNTAFPGEVDIFLGVNMHESFRWQDQDQPGYTDGVFDVTPTSFEPVLKFGANSFDVTVSSE